MTLLSIFSFTVLQAALSAVFSCLIAIPLARALMRRNFALRGFLTQILLLPFFLPQLAIITGIFALLGRAGLLTSLGIPTPPIFGLSGIVLGHTLLNAPLVLRLIIDGWHNIPDNEIRLARSLAPNAAGLPILERRVLRAVLPYGAALTFLFCMLSFTIPLVMGGGPKATTLELAIYQALVFDFDLPRAAQIGALQIILGLSIFALVTRTSPNTKQSALPGDYTLTTLPAPQSRRARASDIISITLISACLLLPLVTAIAFGMRGLWPLITLTGDTLGPAMLTSILMSLTTGLLATLTAAALIWRKKAALAFITAALSPIALSVLLILVLRPLTNPFEHGIIITIAMQTLATLPIATYILQQGRAQITPEHHKLIRTLSMPRIAQLRLIIWPLMKPAALRSISIVSALAVGDLSVLPMVAPPGFENLPLLLYRLLGRYRFQEAAGMALILIMLMAAFLIISQYLARKRPYHA